MTMFWGLLIVIVVLSAAWMARPFLRAATVEVNDVDGTISVFRDQLDEVDRDLAQGLISQEERDAASREIEARALKAARDIDGGLSVSSRSLPLAATVIAFSGLVAVAGYYQLGMPNYSDMPLADRKLEILERRAATGDINSRISLMIEKTSENPDSFEDWWTLAVSYATIGDHASSVDAYRMAAELGGDRPGVMSSYGEAMTLANGNKVPQAARVIFELVLKNGPDARARYYIALSKAQSQDFEGALLDWASLAEESQPNAPWMPLVRRDIVNMSRFLEVDVTAYLPDATPAEIAKAGGAQGSEIAALREGELEEKLNEDPVDYAGWIELASIRAESGDDEGALEALQKGRENYQGAPFVLTKFDEAARDLGLDILGAESGVGGPTDADIAAAADMTEDERNQMIEGMVAGLAAKLEENPENPDGWVMLIRSYATLGNTEAAQNAYNNAIAHFAGNAPALTQIETEVGGFLGRTAQ